MEDGNAYIFILNPFILFEIKIIWWINSLIFGEGFGGEIMPLIKALLILQRGTVSV